MTTTSNEPQDFDDLRVEYHRLVFDGRLVGDKDLLHDVIDEHVNKLESVYAGEAVLTACDLFLGQMLFPLLERSLLIRDFNARQRAHIENLTRIGIL